jgi:serpin B
MHTAAILAMLGTLLATSIACAADTPTTQPAQAAVTASNLFALDLYSQIRSGDGNICISPYSVSSALEMAAAGAGGKTAEQMLSVLHWTGNADELPAAASALNALIAPPPTTRNTESPEAQISIANALFGQKGFDYHQPFLNLLAQQYGAPLQNVDFAGQPGAACEQINNWAAKQTHNRIMNAVPPSAITAQTRLIVVDAIYFKAAWENEFRKSSTSDQPFFLEGKDPVQIPLMQLRESCNYVENETLQAVELPYRGDFSLVVLLPRKREGLSDLEKSLTATSLDGWMKQMARQSVQVFLPKFRTVGEYELNQPLAKLGMTDAFNAQAADFSGITSAVKLCIDRVIHKTFISVDETGTEAAAITSVTMRMTAVLAPRHQQPTIFRADHPFVYLLRHRPTGAILFIGRVTNPK